MTQYIIAGILLAVVVSLAVAFSRGKQTGEACSEAKAYREGAKRREKGDEVMSEPVADEDSWLERQRRRLTRMREQSKQP